MKRLILALTAGVMVAGCGTSVYEGEVVDKYYSEPYTYYVDQCVVWNTQTGACTAWFPFPYEEPEHYVITLQNCDLREDDEDSCPQERWNVDPATYNGLQLGDWFDTGRE